MFAAVVSFWLNYEPIEEAEGENENFKKTFSGMMIAIIESYKDEEKAEEASISRVCARCVEI